MLWDRTLGFRRDLRMRTHVNPAAPPPRPLVSGHQRPRQHISYVLRPFRALGIISGRS